MELFFFSTQEEAQQAAEDLRKLGRHARKLLAECIETSGVKRTKVSAAAEALHAAGFVFIRDSSSVFETEIQISPSLAGEEALEYLEELEMVDKKVNRLSKKECG